ncbi:MAG: glycosyltransferase [Planctomycetes bacterium]|nr:glycosyltransferase [Planctomycetota bacterium]
MTSSERSSPAAAPPLAAPPTAELSVVILNWNTADLLLACLRALARHSFAGSHEILVVDNGSSDGSADRVAAEFPGVRLVRNAANLGYSAGNNVGLRLARGRHILLLNSDTEVGPGALDRLVAFLDRHPRAGAVSCRLTHPDGSLQPSCMRFPTLATALVFDTFLGRLPAGRRHLDRYFMRDFDHAAEREVDQVPGTCTCVPRAVLREVGLLDERLWLFFNDVDLCRRIRATGRTVHFLPDVSILHHHGASTARFVYFAVEWHLNRVAYYRKHFGRASVLITKPVALYVALRQMWKFTVLRQVPPGSWCENMRFVWRGLWRVLRS